MLTSILLLSLMADPQSNRPTSEEMYAYEQARAEAGRDAEAHVQLALWCERHGLSARRLEHLALALMADPAHATARGLMGMVRDAETWRRPEQVARRVKSDADRAAALAEYNARRDKTPMTADEQWDLALWCEQHGLAPEATAHLTAVVRLDPSREAAWKRLGCRKYKGRWLTEEQIKASIAEAEAQEKADRHWGPRLAKLRDQLHDLRKREQAEAELSSITDPRAVPSVWKVFALGSAGEQRRASQILAQIDGPAASKALATIALFARSEEARRAASESLLWRDPREFIGPLIQQIRKEIDYEVKHVGGPGSPGELFIAGERANVHRVYATPAPADIARPGDFLMGYDHGGQPVVGRVIGLRSFQRPVNQGNSSRIDPSQLGEVNLSRLADFLDQAPVGKDTRRAAHQAAANQMAGYDRLLSGPNFKGGSLMYETTLPVVAAVPIGRMRQEAQRAALSSEQKLQTDVAYLDRMNREITTINMRAIPILKAFSGQDFGDDQEQWARWWTENQGYAFQENSTTPTTIQQVIPPAYHPAATPIQVGLGPGSTRIVKHSCFAAGTPVRTLNGSRPIESIRVGDRVLTQNVTSGSLSFQPVLAIYHNPPDRTLRIGLERAGEAIVATPIHRFWKAGVGWTMARELKPGDAIRTLGGLDRIASIEASTIQPVFNLEVARGHSFFVGEAGILVHDNSLIETVDHPFDATPALARLSKGRK